MSPAPAISTSKPASPRALALLKTAVTTTSNKKRSAATSNIASAPERAVRSPRSQASKLATPRADFDPNPYLLLILQARVYEVARETPLDAAPRLSRRLGRQVLLKREDLQDIFSFKCRGAMNKMAHLSSRERAAGVICASAGNHAQGVALAAHKLGCRAVIVVPVTTPQLKVQAVRALGGEVVLVGESYSDAYAHAKALEKRERLTFVHPFDDPLVIAGQGTVAMELLHQSSAAIEAVFVPIGGGGLIAGVAAYIKALRPDIRVVGVQMVDSDAMTQSVQAGERVVLSEVGLFSDGTAVKQVGEETFRVASACVDEFIRVTTDEVCAAMKDIFEDTRSVVEPAGALAVAGLKQWAMRKQRSTSKAKAKADAQASSTDSKSAAPALVAITSGANMNFDRLRFVAERAEVGEAREALFAITIPEARGSFLHFCELIGPRNVTEFNYRISDSTRAHILVGLQTERRGDNRELAQLFRHAGFQVHDLSEDELGKQHIRHMVGGASKQAQGERLLRFVFPERPGALMKFLSSVHPDWNISLFNYRNLGADYGSILVGLQIRDTTETVFKRFLKQLGYPYVEETNNPAYRLFL